MYTLTPKMIEVVHGLMESLNRVADLGNAMAYGTMADISVSLSWKGDVSGSITVSRQARSEQIRIDVDLHGLTCTYFELPKHGLHEVQNWIEHNIH